MMWVWHMIPGPWKLAGTAIALVALVGLYAVHRNQIYTEGFRAAEIRCEQDKAALAEANRKAIAEAEKRLLRAADELSLKNLELDDALAAIESAASADPDGGTLCLSGDSVRRLNEAVR